MSFKTTYILFGILGVVAVIFAVALWRAPLTPPDTRYVFPSVQDPTTKVESGDIVRVEIHHPDQTLVFVREGGEKKGPFRMEEPSGYRVNDSLVHTLISQVLGAQKVEAADLTDDLGQWGLKDPKGRVVLKTEGGRELTMYLGNTSGDRLYVTSSDQPKTPMALVKSNVDTIFNSVNDFRSRELFAGSTSDIKYLRVQEPKKGPVVLESHDGQWKFVKPDYGAADAEGGDDDKGPTGVRSLLTAVTDLRVEDRPEDEKKDKTKEKKRNTGFVNDRPSADDLKKYGLEGASSAGLVVEVKTDLAKKSGQTLLVGNKADDKGDLYYAMVEGDKSVVTLPAKPIDTLKKFLDYPEKVRDRDLVRMSEGPDVVRIKYASGEPVDLVKSESKERGPHGAFPAGGDTWMLYRDKDKKGLKTDFTAVNNLITALKKKRLVEEFPTGKSDTELGLKDPDVVVSLWANGVKPEDKKEDKKEEKKKEEKKDDKKKEDKKEGDRPQLKSETPDVVLEFGRVDSNKLVAVRRKTAKDLKEVLVVKVPASVLEVAKEDPLRYLERTVSPLLTVDEEKKLTKIVIDVDSKLTELIPADPKDDKKGWVFSKPADLKGRKADSGSVNIQVLSTVNGPQVQRWMSLKPSPDDLARWGLKADAPATGKLTLTVKADGKDKDVYLLLGKQTDKKEYYAKRSDLDSIFLISAAEVDRLKQPLLDLKVFEFTPSDVKAVKLTGWPRGGEPYVLEIERKSAGSWVAKNKSKLEVNSARVDKVLDALRDLTAEKIVAFGTGPKAEQGLDYEKGAVEIELTLDKDKLTLMLGKEEGGSYFATSNKLSNKKDVFQVGKGMGGIFEEVKKDPDYLVKK
ncbi:MAG: DUF4340 domain-containing protein [Planctomycetes bacterium]|nr:DUF4340 domain-containing protein [Planctomycetota bacterium]